MGDVVTFGKRVVPPEFEFIFEARRKRPDGSGFVGFWGGKDQRRERWWMGGRKVGRFGTIGAGDPGIQSLGNLGL